MWTPGGISMKPWIAMLTACAFLIAPQIVLSDEHLVTNATTQARLSQAATQREEDVLLLKRVFSSPQASAAAALGAPVARARAAVPTLSDRELRDLAGRASALRADPVAGYHEYILHDFITIFLILVLVVAVIELAQHY